MMSSKISAVNARHGRARKNRLIKRSTKRGSQRDAPQKRSRTDAADGGHRDTSAGCPKHRRHPAPRKAGRRNSGCSSPCVSLDWRVCRHHSVYPSSQFILLQCAFVLGWIILSHVFPHHAFDEYPFPLLATIL